MPKTLLLGGELHGQLRSASDEAAAIEIEIDVIPSRETATGYGGKGTSLRRAVTVTYYRMPLNCGPPDALVYAVEGYEPTPEDEDLVIEAFG